MSKVKIPTFASKNLATTIQCLADKGLTPIYVTGPAVEKIMYGRVPKEDDGFTIAYGQQQGTVVHKSFTIDVTNGTVITNAGETITDPTVSRSVEVLNIDTGKAKFVTVVHGLFADPKDVALTAAKAVGAGRYKVIFAPGNVVEVDVRPEPHYKLRPFVAISSRHITYEADDVEAPRTTAGIFEGLNQLSLGRYSGAYVLDENGVYKGTLTFTFSAVTTDPQVIFEHYNGGRVGVVFAVGNYFASGSYVE